MDKSKVARFLAHSTDVLTWFSNPSA